MTKPLEKIDAALTEIGQEFGLPREIVSESGTWTLREPYRPDDCRFTHVLELI